MLVFKAIFDQVRNRVNIFFFKKDFRSFRSASVYKSNKNTTFAAL